MVVEQCLQSLDGECRALLVIRSPSYFGSIPENHLLQSHPTRSTPPSSMTTSNLFKDATTCGQLPSSFASNHDWIHPENQILVVVIQNINLVCLTPLRTK
jgi:hypothetical protein